MRGSSGARLRRLVLRSARRLDSAPHGFTYEQRQFQTVTGGPFGAGKHHSLAARWTARSRIPGSATNNGSRRFEKTRNRDQIEKTEDVLLGPRAHLQVGFASPSFGADRSATVFDADRARLRAQRTARQRLLLSSSLTGRNEGGACDVVARVAARYCLRQSERRLLFLSALADVASNLDADHQLLIGGDNGLRGYSAALSGGRAAGSSRPSSASSRTGTPSGSSTSAVPWHSTTWAVPGAQNPVVHARKGC